MKTIDPSQFMNLADNGLTGLKHFLLFVDTMQRIKQDKTLWHGSYITPDVAMREGLKPQGSDGADAWRHRTTLRLAKAAGIPDEVAKDKTKGQIRAPALYLTPDAYVAGIYAYIASKLHRGSVPTIYKVALPDAMIDAIGPDYHSGEAVSIETPIPPSYIVAHETVSGDMLTEAKAMYRSNMETLRRRVAEMAARIKRA